MSVSAVVVARNEEKNIGPTLSSIMDQSLSLEKIVLVDDGSTDRTPQIGKKLGCEVISLPPHEENYVGRPELAIRVNVGLKWLKKNGLTDYILQMGGDHVLTPNYLEDVICQMNDRIVVASGRIEGAPYLSTMPPGSGRVVRSDFWMKASDLLYPLEYGWESWLIYKAWKMGYKTACFSNIRTQGRIKRLNSKKAVGLGKSMWCLGYHWIQANARFAITFVSFPKGGILMLYGWITHRGCHRLDVADYVHRIQMEGFANRVKLFLKSGGRR